MRIFLDLEFIEDGKTIDPLSIGLVAGDGRELYAVNKHADITKASLWVKQHVLPRLHDSVGCEELFCDPRQIALRVVEFCSVGSSKPEFWGYYADYDWVCFCQLFGTMMDLPKGFPMYCRDIKQLCDMLGNPKLPPQGKDEHHALLDARWNKQALNFLLGFRNPLETGLVV